MSSVSPYVLLDFKTYTHLYAAYKGTTSAITQQSSTGLVFNYPDNDALAPTAGTNLDAARTNAFYGEL